MRLLLVERSALFRESLRRFLEKKCPMNDIAEGDDLFLIQQQIAVVLPDAILLDLSLFRNSDLESAGWIHLYAPHIPVIILYGYFDRVILSQGCIAEAFTCIAKDSVFNDLPAAINELDIKKGQFHIH